MKRFESMLLNRFVIPAVVATVLAGCGAMDVKKEVVETANQVRTGPEQAPFRSITNFSESLRCMDNQMITFGVQDLSVLVEELKDETKKVNAGTRDMLISAVSDMTKRSRAVRLVVYGPDAGNLIGFLHQAERKTAYSALPRFDIKGSISQFDDNVAKKDASAGASIAPYFNFGYSRTGGATIMGVDLTMVNTEDLSVVPGVTARNAVLIQKQGTALDSEAQYHKFGINFTAALARNEGNAQALRNLIELAVIELFGKLTKTPYWLCLGADPKSDPVRTEIADWYYTMTGDASEMIAYFQYQLSIRGFYVGPADGKGNAALAEAISRYRVALDLAPGSKIDREFFAAYLNGDHARIQAQNAGKAPAVAKVPPPAPISLAISSGRRESKFRPGEKVNFSVSVDRDAYVYCFMRDQANKVLRVYPNRYAKDPLVRTAQALEVPGKMKFTLHASEDGTSSTVACFAAPKDVLASLPLIMKTADFQALPGFSLAQVRTAFASVSGPQLGEASFEIQVR
jgi:hypothetical protein